MAICRTEAIVLRGFKLGESSKIITLYTQNYGKIKGVAKGVRRPKSRFGASLEPITHSLIVFYHKEGRDLHTLSDGDILTPFIRLKGDFACLTYASAICELTDRLMVGEEPNRPLFGILLDALHGIEEASPEDAEKFLWRYELGLFELLGYQPGFNTCVHCGRSPRERALLFSHSLGGVLCEKCRGQDPRARPIFPGTARFLFHLQRASMDRIAHLKTTPEMAEQIRTLLSRFLAYHTENYRELNSLDFLRKVAESPTVIPYEPSKG
jgi:DNA repair protein RecO (recombination protein O)